MTNALADRFFALHEPGRPLVLPNAWDPASAAIVERAGFAAIATSSAAAAWTLGYADGEKVDTGALFEALARIVRVTKLPVSADIEAGFGTSPAAAARSAERAIEAGAVGINLEDYDPISQDVVTTEAHCERIAAVVEKSHALGVRLFVNARTDLLLYELGPDDDRIERAIERLNAFASAGANGLFAPGVDDAATIERIVRAVKLPFNVLAGAATPSVAELSKLGVARISLGSVPAKIALTALHEFVTHLHDRGTFDEIAKATLSYGEINALFPAVGDDGAGL